MSRRASLPMYNFRGMQQANAGFWRALRGLIEAEGCAALPDRLEFDQPPVPEAISPDTLFTQTCGYPLQTIYRGQYRCVATPSYVAPGCGVMTHCAFFVVRDDDTAGTIEALRGRRFAVNSPHSNSGMNLPRRSLAPLADKGRFFSKVELSGSHPLSLRMVQQRLVDAASIDCLTWAFALDHAPEMVAGLRVLAETVPSPAIPFIAGGDTSDEEVATLRRALSVVAGGDEYDEVRAALKLGGIGQVQQGAYDVLLDYERQARDLGYAEIA